MGVRVSAKRVMRLMTRHGLVPLFKSAKRYSSYKGELTKAPANLVNRDFHAERPNMLWVTDLTEFSIPAGKAYLSPVIDCYDGMPVAWTIGTSPNAALDNGMLADACSTLKDGEKPIIHSDRGCHYRWPEWIRICKDNNLTRSMSAKGCSPDNAAAEGFFGRLKQEFFHKRSFAGVSMDGFIETLDDYMVWYRDKRIKTEFGMSIMDRLRELGLVACLVVMESMTSPTKQHQPNVATLHSNHRNIKRNQELQNSKFESDLSQVPQLYDEIKSLVEITNKKEIKQICDKIMEILAIVKKGKTLPDKEIITILKQSLLSVEKLTLETKEEQDDVTLVLQRLDIIKQMMDLNSSVNPLSNLSSTLDESSLPVKKAQDFFNSFETTSIRTLRVDSKKLDRLVSQMGELIIGRIKHKKNISELENILSDLTEWRNFNHKSQSFIKYYDRKYINSEDAVDYSTLSVFSKQIFSIFQENSSKIIKLNNRILNLQKSLDEEDTKLNTIVTQLESMIKNIRVLPLATIFHMFPRMIRDISKDTGKDIELLISGSETSADKKVIEEIKAPLMHIIRNSIDHGIETPQERIAAGKSPKGKIYLIAKSMQNKIIIEIHDDGRGIDLQKIVNRALEKNMITQKEAQYLSAEQIMNIIFWPGFSTEQVVTELSGRGVGLDIVQTKISQLNGTVKVFSVPNQGTKITIELPISMSTLKAFIVECSQQFFAMPMTSIKNVMWIKEEDIYLRNDTKSIIIEGKTVNLFYLSELMKLPLSEESSKSNKKTVILIEVENSLMGIIVDRILGDQNILQKKLDPPIIKLKNISGITTLANGDVCLILNLPELYKSTYTPVEKPLIPVPSYKLRARENKDYKILIVDDSITTRELLKNILIHWGYSFEMVKNPKEAFEILYKENFDLILSDMEMPEMDGSMFIKELKNTPKFKDIPVVLITSYDTERLAKDIPDIDAFIKKSNFNQDYLLDVIEKLLKYE